ncbi:MAG TPA: hypothetical protein VF064_13910 [Pyrinomonadaceae bacterium]
MPKREPPGGRLLAEKIAPPATERRLTRGRLLADLGESLACCSATVISGRAGTGKTTLAADFAGRAGRAAAWYKVEAPDADLPVFFKYLCASVARRRPGFGAQALWMLGETLMTGDVPLLVECFVSELLCLDEPLLVVVDDLHFVYDEEWTVRSSSSRPRGNSSSASRNCLPSARSGATARCAGTISAPTR